MNYLCAFTTAPAWDENDPQPGDVVLSKSYSDGVDTWLLYLCGHDISEMYPTGKLIGIWFDNGVVNSIIDPDYMAYINPFGNAAGVASDDGDYHHWQGHSQRQMQASPAPDSNPLYPADAQPYIITMTRTHITDDGFPATPWGFKLTIDFVDPSRDPSARSIGVYSDPECTAYLWTPGAFVWTDTGEVDDNDDPIFKWTINCPVGQRTADRTDWHVANLFGAAQEGHYTLPAYSDEFTRYFWQYNAGAGWADSGETAVAVVGAGVIRVSDTAPFEALDKIRIDGTEAIIQSIFTPGVNGIITIDPHIAVTGGEAIEIWQ